MMASGRPPAWALPIELDGLVDRVTTGGGGDVDELLDVPPGRLGPVGVDVEAAEHPRRRHRRRRPGGCDRYGYQSVRAGSHRCTWASTTRVGRAVIRLHVVWVVGGTDDLPERGVEPTGDGGAAVGDAADRPGVTAKAEPARADHQLRTGEGRGLGMAEQMGDERTDRSAGRLLRGLDAHREGRDAPFGRTSSHAGQLRRGLGSTATSGGDGVGEGHQLDRTVGAGGVVGGRPGPSGVGVDVLDDPAVLGEHPLPAVRRGGRRARWRRAPRRRRRSDRWLRPRRSAPRRRPAKPCATSRRWQVIDRASSAAVSDAASCGRSVTTAHDRTCGGSSLDGGRLVEDRPEPGVAAAAARLARLGRGERSGDDGLEHPGQGDHLVAAHHLEQPGLVDHRHLRAAGEEHLAGAPAESVTDEVRAERARGPPGPASTRGTARRRRRPRPPAGRARRQRRPFGWPRWATWR